MPAPETPSVTPTNQTVASIHQPLNPITGGLYRIAGLPDRYILKVLQAPDSPLEETAGRSGADRVDCWRREALLFRSGLLSSLPAIRAPQCLGVTAIADNLALLWLEDLGDLFQRPWTLDHYRVAARRLGEFNAYFLVRGRIPDAPFLSRDRLRHLVDGYRESLARLSDLREHPLLRRCWPGDLIDRLLQLCHERGSLLGKLDALPQTFCHLDAFPRNLAVTDEHLIAVDWSCAGIAPLGAEIAPMVPAAVLFFDAEPEHMRDLSEAVIGAYIDGLRTAGWDADTAAVRFACTTTMALQYGLYPMGVHLADDQVRPRFERALGHSAAEIAARWAKAVDLLLGN